VRQMDWALSGHNASYFVQFIGSLLLKSATTPSETVKSSRRLPPQRVLNSRAVTLFRISFPSPVTLPSVVLER